MAKSLDQLNRSMALGLSQNSRSATKGGSGARPKNPSRSGYKPLSNTPKKFVSGGTYQPKQSTTPTRSQFQWSTNRRMQNLPGQQAPITRTASAPSGLNHMGVGYARSVGTGTVARVGPAGISARQTTATRVSQGTSTSGMASLWNSQMNPIQMNPAAAMGSAAVTGLFELGSSAVKGHFDLQREKVAQKARSERFHAYYKNYMAKEQQAIGVRERRNIHAQGSVDLANISRKGKTQLANIRQQGLQDRKTIGYDFDLKAKALKDSGLPTAMLFTGGGSRGQQIHTRQHNKYGGSTVANTTFGTQKAYSGSEVQKVTGLADYH